MPNNHNPLVTVVIPTHNREKYLVEAVNSVINQTTDQWRVIIVDDASDAPVILPIEISDHRISIIHNTTNCGVSTSRNIGAKSAKSEWILFLDDDDWLDERFIEEMLHVIEIDGVKMDFIWPRRRLIYMGTDRTEESANRDNRIENGLGSEDDFFHIIDPLCTGMAFKKSTLLQNGGFDTSLKVSEDRDLIFRMLSKNCSCRSASAPLLKFRIHSNERLSNNTKGSIQASCDLEVLSRHNGFLAKHPRLAKRYLGRTGKKLWRLGMAKEAIMVMHALQEIAPNDFQTKKRMFLWSLFSKLRLPTKSG